MDPRFDDGGLDADLEQMEAEQAEELALIDGTLAADDARLERLQATEEAFYEDTMAADVLVSPAGTGAVPTVAPSTLDADMEAFEKAKMEARRKRRQAKVAAAEAVALAKEAEAVAKATAAKAAVKAAAEAKQQRRREQQVREQERVRREQERAAAEAKLLANAEAAAVQELELQKQKIQQQAAAQQEQLRRQWEEEQEEEQEEEEEEEGGGGEEGEQEEEQEEGEQEEEVVAEKVVAEGEKASAQHPPTGNEDFAKGEQRRKVITRKRKKKSQVALPVAAVPPVTTENAAQATFPVASSPEPQTDTAQEPASEDKGTKSVTQQETGVEGDEIATMSQLLLAEWLGVDLPSAASLYAAAGNSLEAAVRLVERDMSRLPAHLEYVPPNPPTADSLPTPQTQDKPVAGEKDDEGQEEEETVRRKKETGDLAPHPEEILEYVPTDDDAGDQIDPESTLEYVAAEQGAVSEYLPTATVPVRDEQAPSAASAPPQAKPRSSQSQSPAAVPPAAPPTLPAAVPATVPAPPYAAAYAAAAAGGGGVNLDLHGLEIRHAAELLVGLKQSVLRKRAIAAGADEGELDAADDALDTKACLAVLLLQKYAGVLTKSWQLSTDPAAASLMLRMDLGAIVKMSALRKRAIQDGVTAEALEEADDAEDMRAALIEAIVVHAAKTVVTATLPAAAKEVTTSTEGASGAAQSHADSVAVVPTDSLLQSPPRAASTERGTPFLDFVDADAVGPVEQLGDMFGGVDAEQEEKQQVATQDEIQASIPIAKEPAARPVARSTPPPRRRKKKRIPKPVPELKSEPEPEPEPAPEPEPEPEPAPAPAPAPKVKEIVKSEEANTDRAAAQKLGAFLELDYSEAEVLYEKAGGDMDTALALYLEALDSSAAGADENGGGAEVFDGCGDEERYPGKAKKSMLQRAKGEEGQKEVKRGGKREMKLKEEKEDGEQREEEAEEEQGEALPTGWESTVDTRGRRYYFHRELGVQQWARPEQHAQKLHEPEEPEPLPEVGQQERGQDQQREGEDLPPGWEVTRSSRTGEKYANYSTGQSQFEHPTTRAATQEAGVAVDTTTVTATVGGEVDERKERARQARQAAGAAWETMTRTEKKEYLKSSLASSEPATKSKQPATEANSNNNDRHVEELKAGPAPTKQPVKELQLFSDEDERNDESGEDVAMVDEAKRLLAAEQRRQKDRLERLAAEAEAKKLRQLTEQEQQAAAEEAAAQRLATEAVDAEAENLRLIEKEAEEAERTRRAGQEELMLRYQHQSRYAKPVAGIVAPMGTRPGEGELHPQKVKMVSRWQQQIQAKEQAQADADKRKREALEREFSTIRRDDAQPAVPLSPAQEEGQTTYLPSAALPTVLAPIGPRPDEPT
eukprot:COSAG05_NODE_1611_length_4408_cov_1.939893_1_plen_1371_part_10